MTLAIAEGAFVKGPFSARAPTFDTWAINETIQIALAPAGLETTSGPMRSVTETIRRAPASGGMVDASGAPVASESVIDVMALVVDVEHRGCATTYDADATDESRVEFWPLRGAGGGRVRTSFVGRMCCGAVDRRLGVHSLAQ
jgi:hypothetical protein